MKVTNIKEEKQTQDGAETVMEMRKHTLGSETKGGGAREQKICTGNGAPQM